MKLFMVSYLWSLEIEKCVRSDAFAIEELEILLHQFTAIIEKLYDKLSSN